MKKTRIIISLTTVGVILIASFCMLIGSVNNAYDYKNNSYIFETISELNFLNEYVVEEGLNLDKKIAQIASEEIQQSKTVKINYNGSEIYVFAYIFSSVNSCIDYANKVSSNDYQKFYNGNNLAKYFYYHKSFLNLFQSEELLVFSNEKAYVVKAKISDKKFNQFITYFMGELNTKVEFTY